MKSFVRKGLATVGLTVAASVGAQSTTYITNSFSQTFNLTASPDGSLPQIDTIWNVPQYDGFGGLTSLSGVRYDVTTQLFYRGVLVALGAGANTPFNLLVRSDFNFNLPTTTADVGTLDPQILLNPTSGQAGVQFNVPGPNAEIASSTANSATRLASDLSTYVGNGTVPVTVTGSLLTTNPGGNYHNTTDTGMPSPFVFVDNAKVFPVFGLQEFSLVATMTVTYAVPEPGTYGAAGALTVLIGARWLAHRRNRSRSS